MLGREIVETGIDPSSESVTTGKLPDVPMAALEFHLSGTTDTGETLTMADIANSLQVRHKSRGVFSDLSAEDWHALNLLWGGTVRSPSNSDNTAEDVVWYLLFYQPEIPQAIHVPPEEYAFRFDWDDVTLSTRFGGAGTAPNVDIHAVRSDLEELYLPVAVQDNLDVRDAGGQTQQWSDPNITRLIFRENNGANITNLEIDQTLRSGRTEQVITNATLASLIDWQDFYHERGEGSTRQSIAEWNAIDGMADVSLFSRATQIQYAADAAGDLDVRYFRLGDPINAALSRERIRNAA